MLSEQPGIRSKSTVQYLRSCLNVMHANKLCSSQRPTVAEIGLSAMTGIVWSDWVEA